jgi:leucyl-tRNA synthetase
VYLHTQKGTVPALDLTQLDNTSRDLRRKTHETIAKTSDDIARRYAFNTAIAAIMELLNAIQKLDAKDGQALAVEREALETVVLCVIANGATYL